jgi:para-aminobenzoate synthetase/4-amino-4-deoxychorismate lyase
MHVCALVDFSAPAGAEAPRLRLAFGRPREILEAHQPGQIRQLLDTVHSHALQGRWCVGYLRYEAAAAFDPAMRVHAAEGPLAWFAIHDDALPWPDAEEGDPPGDVTLAWDAPLSRRDFDEALGRIHEAIANGEAYQVNFTQMLRASLRVQSGMSQGAASRRLFDALQRAQPGGYAAWIDTGEEQVLSVSPELFFDWRGGRLLARPMKGTAARGATGVEDDARAQALRASAKERAENVMIVDLLRNDMSRVAEPFSVRVERLFNVAALPTVWQMTSDIEARTRSGTTLADVFAALFPCGSVTGAPKLSAMRLIHELEGAARGIYCGAVGVVQPGGAATFNVPIRTVTMKSGVASCGIGSGITADARAEGEWQEWRHKRAFLERASAPFEILETLALDEGVLRDAPAHLARMGQAAAHFGYPWDAGLAAQHLGQLAQAHATGRWRVRLLLDRRGALQAQAHAQEAPPPRVRLRLVDRAFEASDSEFVRFKTTRRAHYDDFAPTQPGVFDTLLWNRNGELTECTRGNIALQLEGRWVTPPLHCGLLAGVGRARCLREGRIEEAVVRVQDLPRVRSVAFINSLRGWIEAGIDNPAGPATESR